MRLAAFWQPQLVNSWPKPTPSQMSHVTSREGPPTVHPPFSFSSPDALSVSCKYLRIAWIHFNVDDIRFLSEDPDLRDLWELPKRCPLKHFDAGRLRYYNYREWIREYLPIHIRHRFNQRAGVCLSRESTNSRRREQAQLSDRRVGPIGELHVLWFLMTSGPRITESFLRRELFA